MKISGFTFIKNAVAYDFPVVESVRSVLPVVDEFIIVAGDSSDGTDELLKVFDGEPKVRIIRTVWDTQTYDRGGMIYAQQTDVGLRACTGDWCLYIQSDEIMHHDALPVIREACAKYLDATGAWRGFCSNTYIFTAIIVIISTRCTSPIRARYASCATGPISIRGATRSRSA